MPIVFGCPRCSFVMKCPEDKGGMKIKCMQCDLPMEIPHLRGILVDVPPEQATPLVFGISAPRHGSAHGSAQGIAPGVQVPRHGSPQGVAPRPIGSAQGTAPTPAATNRIDQYFREASEYRDANDLESAVRMLGRAYEEIKRENAVYPVDAYLRISLYLQQAGKTREAWADFNKLLFQGYFNQPKEGGRVSLDRARILERMRLFLDRDSKSEIGNVYSALAQVCEGVGLFREGKTREVRTRYNKATCEELAGALKKYTGNLGPLQDVRTIIMEELNRWPDLEFERLGSRVDAVFFKAVTAS